MRRNPFEEFEEMLDRMSRQVEEGLPRGTGFGSVPVDVRDAGDAFEVTADLPGYDAEDIDLTLSGKRLEIAADRETEAEVTGEDFVRRERTTASVSRSVGLPEAVDAESVEANLEDGVLTVTLPKAHHEAGHSIEIDEE